MAFINVNVIEFFVIIKLMLKVNHSAWLNNLQIIKFNF